MSANHWGGVRNMSPELGSNEEKRCYKTTLKEGKFMICSPNQAFIQDLDLVGVGRTQGMSPNIYLEQLLVGCLRSNASCI